MADEEVGREEEGRAKVERRKRGKVRGTERGKKICRIEERK